jgi:hypothetical protein
VGAFAVDYADQTEADYQVFLRSRFARKKKAPARKPKLKPTTVIKESKPKA